tara:strand:+ start:1808 stop:3235 length:1428 start_codon:yes stop_codon:yes gene_type:complete
MENEAINKQQTPNLSGPLAPTAKIKSDWNSVYEALRSEFGEAVFRSWLKPLTLQAFYHGTLEVSVPTRFMRDWIQNHYQDKILGLCAARNTEITRLEIVVVQSSVFDTEKDSASANANKPANKINGKDVATLQETLASPLDSRFNFDSFVVGEPNALAHAAAQRVAQSETVPFNPLYLHGGVGLGKTHLMHAIAWDIQKRRPDARVVYLSAEKFMYQFVRSLRYEDTMTFKEFFRSVDVLMIDDIQFISGKESTQEEFFHTFNALVDQNKQIVISSDKSPSDLVGVDERLRSRLGWGLVVDLQPSTYELRRGILESKAAQFDVEIPSNVIEFLAHKISSNIRELEGALNRIVAHAGLVGQAVTLESTQQVLSDLLRASERRITIDEIQRKVAEHYGIRMTDMHSARRARAVARPRQIAMYLCKRLTQRSLPEIGRKFGGRDHTTVMHAVRKVEELIDQDNGFADDVDVVRRALTG